MTRLIEDSEGNVPVGILNRAFAAELEGKKKDCQSCGGADSLPTPVGKYTSSEKWRIIGNTLYVSVSFMLIFTGMAGTEALQSSLHARHGLGTIALSCVYLGVVVANIFLSSLVIRWLGCKWTMVVAMVLMMPFVAAQYHASFYSLIPLGLVNGMATGVNWVAASTYITVISEMYAKITGSSKEVIVTRFFSLFFMFYQTAQILGSLISSTVLTQEETDAGRLDAAMCGFNFCPAPSNHSSAQTTSDNTVLLIAGSYLCVMSLTVPLLCILLDSLDRYEDRVRERESGIRLLVATYNVFVEEPSVKLVLPITFFLGLEKCFIMSTFTHAFVTCSVGIMNVGYVMIAFGVTNAYTTPLTAWIANRVGRVTVVVTASCMHTLIIVTLVVWTPEPSQSHVLYYLAALWGVAEGIWMVQINALYGLVFKGKEEAAFSNYRVFRGCGYTVGYLTSSFFCTDKQLYALLAVLVLGTAGYVAVEVRERRRSREPLST